MTKRKNKGLAVLFSFIPGVGHMYLGFMKMGVSIMGVFFAVIVLANYLEFWGLFLLLPILWFYGFFDAVNKGYMTDEEYAKLEDKYLFSLDKLISDPGSIFAKGRLLLGVVITLIGVNLLFNRLLDLFNYSKSGYTIIPWVYDLLRAIGYNLPRLIIGAGIVIVGIVLIVGKRKEVKSEK